MNCFYCNKSSDVELAQRGIISRDHDKYIRTYYTSHNSLLDTFCCKDCWHELDFISLFDTERISHAGCGLDHEQLMINYRERPA